MLMFRAPTIQHRHTPTARRVRVRAGGSGAHVPLLGSLCSSVLGPNSAARGPSSAGVLALLLGLQCCSGPEQRLLLRVAAPGFPPFPPYLALPPVPEPDTRASGARRDGRSAA